MTPATAASMPDAAQPTPLPPPATIEDTGLHPDTLAQLLLKTLQQSERMSARNFLPVVLCAPELRRHLRHMTERLVPQLRVLSLAEIPNSAELRAFGTIAI